ncbi:MULTISPECIES: glycosyltransferase family 4 protein [Methylotenera]|uniref:glycosyltransferase family 4 protein n=1 Tax=Methylotenera TaxID=359407 RepID=UPI00035C5635|nr:MULTISPECIES: glycosyltransferase family 4 protein [Methylotenera]
MRVAYILNQYPKVSHTFIRREILALERLGIEVQRISMRGWDESQIDSDDISEQAKTQYVLKEGVFPLLFSALKILLTKPIAFITASKLAIKMSIKADRALIYHLIYLFEACQAFNWSQQFKATHIHAHFGTNPSEVAMLMSVLSNVPYSFTVHGPEEFDRPKFLKIDEKINRAKFVVAISSFGKSQLQRWVDFSQWQKIKIVHCGLESSFYKIDAVTFPIKPKFVCVGRLCEQKGQLILVEAAKKLADANVDFELVLAGDGEMRQQIKALIAQYALQNRITITGWISSEAVRQYILDSQVLVLPSFAEGLPVVIMEAMSLKRPVISTYIAGIPELIKHAENGWLCVAGDVDDLTQTMQHALSTPLEKLQKMGEAAYTSVIARHDIDIEAAKLANHFRQ